MWPLRCAARFGQAHRHPGRRGQGWAGWGGRVTLLPVRRGLLLAPISSWGLREMTLVMEFWVTALPAGTEPPRARRRSSDRGDPSQLGGFLAQGLSWLRMTGWPEGGA